MSNEQIENQAESDVSKEALLEQVHGNARSVIEAEIEDAGEQQAVEAEVDSLLQSSESFEDFVKSFNAIISRSAHEHSDPNAALKPAGGENTRDKALYRLSTSLRPIYGPYFGVE